MIIRDLFARKPAGRAALSAPGRPPLTAAAENELRDFAGAKLAFESLESFNRTAVRSRPAMTESLCAGRLIASG
jgi:hypothetical protein